MKYKHTLFLTESLEELEAKAVSILREAEQAKAIVSLSGGIDSEVIFQSIKKHNINIATMFTNTAIEPSANQKRVKEYKKHFNHTVDARSTTRTYKEIVYKFGFPIKNKGFSDIAHRISYPLDANNFVGRYKHITNIGIHEQDRDTTMGYSLPLEYWYLSKNFPIQQECCRILKKEPSAKLKKDTIVGIMKSDSPERRKAINQSFHGKYFPLADWTKNDVTAWLMTNKCDYSTIYDDRVMSNGDIIGGATNTGCMGCHFGQKENHTITINGIKKPTTKFANLKREKPKLHEYYIKMKHSSGINFRETIECFEQSERGEWIKESIVLRNKDIFQVAKLMKEHGLEKFAPTALPRLLKFIKREV